MAEKLAIEKRVSFELIRYANCWEDADILVEALQIKNSGKCLSIASGGDNTLALLSQDPSLVVAVDVSGVQLACLDLKAAAFAGLEYEELLQFLGFHNAVNRCDIYAMLRRRLLPETRIFWDAHQDLIAGGIIYQGKFERYFYLFRRYLLPLIHGQREISGLLAQKNEAGQVEFYNRCWNNRRWRWLFRIFFSKTVMGRLGRDPEFFRYVEGQVAERILSRVEYALTQLPPHSNPYLRFILTGGFQEVLPFYVRRENFEKIRRNLAKLVLFYGPVEAALKVYPVEFDAFNLSDIFEYMEPALFKQTSGAILAQAGRGSRLAYWNMLVPRRISDLFPEQVKPLPQLADQLFRKDRAFFYQAFLVEEKM